ncbi:hypothetical protein JW868_02960, partial [Candidatus Woesearchaeota archaeon]|nr:hypothetical protein [Candidatus Woesearchaeota archaeon]
RIILTSLIILVVALLTTPNNLAEINASLILENGSQINHLTYDWENTTRQGRIFGSNSFMDHSSTNPNLFISACHPNLTVGQRFDLVYASYSGNITRSVLNYIPRIYSTTNYTNGTDEYNCTTVDVDISSIKAIYPGNISLLLYNYSDRMNLSENSTDLNLTVIEDYGELSTAFNGSYDMKVKVEGPPKVYYIATSFVYDENETEIMTSEPLLVTSLVNSINQSVVETVLLPDEFFAYNQSFHGGERVYVNGLMSLEIRIYNPCDEINESGYYILNNTAWNLNDTCVVIENLTDVVFNFGDEILDGDNITPNGSQDNTSTRCPIIIQNSQNITLEYLYTQEFYYGLCVFNSSVNVFGTNSVSNFRGAYITNSSQVTFADVYFSNEEAEIVALNDSTVNLYRTNVSTAMLQSSFEDAFVKAVRDPPPAPNVSDGFINVTSIDQWVEFRAMDTHSWADINFLYTIPLPNEAAIDNVSIFKYNGTYNYTNVSVFDNETNTTNTTEEYEWVGGNWSLVYTLVSPSELLIMGENQTNFSVFAPYAFEAQAQTEPIEELPVSEPEESAGPKAGGGGAPASPEEFEQVDIFATLVELELTLPENITLMQGEVFEVKFNLTNVGEVSANNIVIEPQVPLKWRGENFSYLSLRPGDSLIDNFLIEVYDKEIPNRLYTFPVNVYVENGTRVLRELLRVMVIPRGDLKKIELIEYPPTIVLDPFSDTNISFEVRNAGDLPLENIHIEIEENPSVSEIIGSNDLEEGETKDLSYIFRSKGVSKVDNLGLKFYAGDVPVGFVFVDVIVEYRQPLLDLIFKSFFTYIILGWSALTVALLSRGRRLPKALRLRRKEKNDKGGKP